MIKTRKLTIIIIVENNVEQIWITNVKKQEIEFRFQRRIQILIGDNNKNGNDQKPTPIRYAHVSVTVNVICKPNIPNALNNSISENEKCIRT